MGFPWFVLVLGIYPTVFAFVHNYGEATAWEALPPVLVGLGMTVVVWGLLFAVRRDWRTAGVATAILVGWFISFDLQWMFVQQLPVVPTKLQAVPLTGVPALLLTGAVLWRLRRPEPLMRPLNTFALILLGLSVLQLGARTVQTAEAVRIPPVEWTARGASDASPDGPTRDIYFVVLDGYARTDMLREFYGYDNSDFIRRLEQKGFHVFEDARANYSKTYLSLASSLNGVYLDEVARLASGRRGPPARIIPYAMIDRNAVMAFLRRQGYTIYSFQTWWGATKEVQAADVNVGCGFSTGREFHRLVLSYTAAWAMRAHLPRVIDDYETQRCLIEKLLRIHEEPGPKFVFAHIITPHHPALFGPNGERSDETPTLLGDPAGWANKEGYLGELVFISSVMERLADNLRAAGEPDPIVVIQSDHGSASSGWDSPDVVRERMPILNALYLPGVDSIPHAQLITPVNTFRFIFSAYFGVARELLPNHSYFSPPDEPYAFIPVDSLWSDRRAHEAGLSTGPAPSCFASAGRGPRRPGDRPRPGRRPAVRLPVAEVLETLLEETPEKHGYKSPGWTVGLLQRHLRNHSDEETVHAG